MLFMDSPVSLIKNKPLKFLGSNVSALNKPQDMHQFLYDKLETKLKNIDSSHLRGEHKLNIYSRYALISMRYYLSVHDLHKTHLDALARKYLKKWLNIPSHGATDISIFHPYLMGQTGNYALMRIKGDSTVQLALDSIPGKHCQ